MSHVGAVHGLFGTRSLPDEAKSRGDEAVRAVERADVNELLGRDLEELVDSFSTDFAEAHLDWDRPSMSEPQLMATESYKDPLGQTVRLPRVRITVSVPLEGSRLLLTYWSHQGAPMMRPLEGTLTEDSLELNWVGDPAVEAAEIVKWLGERKSEIDRFREHNNRDVAALNTGMRNRIRVAIERRRAIELNRRALKASLPFPITRKKDAAVPVRAERKVRVRLKAPPESSPFVPEPELEQSVYEEILQDCVSQATVLERTPLGGWEEEQVRNLLLAQLNINYTGDVGGELFNGSGKTDILIRQADRNVFIGECKFYDGPKSVTDAIDQLLGYLVWRDTKAALLLFVRGGNFTDVVEKAVNAVKTHEQCSRVKPTGDPHRRSDYVFTREDDPDRAIHLALLPFKFLSQSS